MTLFHCIYHHVEFESDTPICPKCEPLKASKLAQISYYKMARENKKTIIHTTSGSQLTYEKERDKIMPIDDKLRDELGAWENPKMLGHREEQMELPNALKKDNPNPSGDQIKGYRKLSDEEVTAINKCKDYGVEIGEVIKYLETIPSVDKRWLAIGRTDLQTGFMALIRSIAKPETF